MPVIITTEPVDTTAIVGGNTTLHCTITGIPLPTVSWLKDGQALQVDDSRILVSTRIALDSPNEKIIVSSLVFSELQLMDDADYQCIANNTGANDQEFSAISETAHLTLQCELFYIKL